ncbi:uncharacterized protein LOC134726654 [Mytilus trossulus]|uniref:uncharacterized protein LOC134726654 n=1 Tax=Mytilus trossulus TaxID=6551 RepID=UPI00300710D0
MASSKPIPCGPCIEGKVKTKADIWCYNYDEGLCSTCSGHHKRSKGKRDHKTNGIKSYKPSVQIIETQCDKHGQQFNLGEQEYQSIKEFIVKLRNEIDKHLTHLEKKICGEADTILNQEKSKARDLIAEIGRKTEKLKENKRPVTYSHTTHFKTPIILGVHQIEQQVHQCQRYIDDLENDERATEFTIKMEKNNDVEKIIKKLGSLGELTVVKTDMDLMRETGVRREAQVELLEQSSINNMTMNIEKKTKINTQQNIVYCNERVIYSDYHGNAVYCVDQSGKQIWQYTQDLSDPRGLCADTYGNIFVADVGSNGIIVISKDGKKSIVLCSDGLDNPKCICLKQNESSGFICDKAGKNLTKFNLSSR